MRAVIVLLPPPITAAAVEDVIVGVCDVGADVPATVDGEVALEPWRGGPAALAAEVWGLPLPDDAELPVPPVIDEAEELVPVGVGATAGPVPAPEAVPSEGVGWHFTERLLVNLSKPSAESGSDAPAGSVPT